MKPLIRRIDVRMSTGNCNEGPPDPGTDWGVEGAWLLAAVDATDFINALRGDSPRRMYAIADVSFTAEDAVEEAPSGILAINPASIHPKHVVPHQQFIQDNGESEWASTVLKYRAKLKRIGVQSFAEAVDRTLLAAGAEMGQRYPGWWMQGWSVHLIRPQFEVLRVEWEDRHEFGLPPAGLMVAYVNLTDSPCPCRHCVRTRRELLAAADWA
jgi:hypothetical protein